LPGWALMLGYAIGGVVRGLVVGAAAAIATLLFTRLHIESVLVTVAALTLAALMASLGGFVAALFAKTFEQIQMIQTSILTPLMFVGGVFNPVSALPAWAQKVALANPMLYMVDAIRYGPLGISDVPVGLSFTLMGALAIVLFFAAMKLLASGKGMRD